MSLSLLEASKNGNRAEVQNLLETGLDVNLKDETSRTALSWAAGNGHHEVVSMLLESGGIEADAVDKTGRTPLAWAVSNGHETAIHVLINKKRDNIDLECEYEPGRTPLSWAAEHGDLSLVNLLVDYANVDAKDRSGRTPLSLAASGGYTGVVRSLIDKHAETDSRDIDGRTPLSWAAGHGHETMVKSLLGLESKGFHIDPDGEDHAQRTPLSWAAASGHDAVVALLLEKKGIDPDSEDSGGRTPLSWAAGNGHDAVVTLLLEKKRVDPDLEDVKGRTPLSWAAGNGHVAVVNRLLGEKLVDPIFEDITGRTPLVWAIENGHEAAETALAPDSPDTHGPDVNIQPVVHKTGAHENLDLEPPQKEPSAEKRLLSRWKGHIFGLVTIPCVRSNMESESRPFFITTLRPRNFRGIYVVVGIMNKKTGIPKERFIKKDARGAKTDLFERIRWAHKSMRPWWRRILSLKAVSGFSMYECHPKSGYHTPVELDQRTKWTLSRFYGEYNTDPKDEDDHWEEWIIEHFNLRHKTPERGKYALELVLGWSVTKIVLYGSTPILLSLAIGFWYTARVGGDNRNAIIQTAWTISAYILASGG
ncbi:hypothetical protein GP486_007707, partial [Trichoglossum hirsutum]